MINLELKNLYKNHEGTCVSDLNLSLKYGEIYGLVCNDHDIKQLIIRIITGLVRPSAGEVRYFSRTRRHGSSVHLRRVGIATDDVYFYEELSGYENIRMYLDAYRKRLNKLDTLSLNARIDNAFKLFNLLTSRDVPVKKYSQGMRQKLKLIRAFVIEPRILILDEPFQSLDPVTIQHLIRHLRFLAIKKGVTVFLLTDMIGYLNPLVDRVGIIRQGTLMEEMTRDELNYHQQSYIALTSKQLPYLLTIIEREFLMFDYEVIDDQTVHIFEEKEHLAGFFERIVNHDVGLSSVKYGFDSLESYFLEKIGE